MNRAWKTLPGAYKMETTGPKVPSRYLSSPTGSCHDSCKCETTQTIETKPINPFPKRVPKKLADRTQIEATNSVAKIKKTPSIIPKATTRNVKNNNAVKDQLKKDVVIEPKKRDLKLKSKQSQAKTYNPPSSRNSRRHSDIFLPSKDMQIPSTKFPKRRLSEITILPNKDVASASNVPLVRGSRINKNESRKDSKLPSLNKKSNSIKTTVSVRESVPKVPPLRTLKSLPKPVLKGSRKSRPQKVVEEVVPEKTQHVIEPDNSVEVTKKPNHISPDASLSSEEKTMTDGQTGLQVSSPSMEDDTKDGQDNENIEFQVSSPSMDDNTPVKDDHGNEQIEQQLSSPSMHDNSPVKDDRDNEETEQQVSSPSMEDDKPTNDDDNNENIGMQASSPLTDDDISTKDDQDNNQNGLQGSSPSMEDDSPTKYDQDNEQIGLQVSSPLPEDESPAKDDQESDTLADFEINYSTDETRSGKLKVETDDESSDDLRFRRGTILSPQSDDNSPRRIEFKKGKELDKSEGENDENTNLRRLSSDGVEIIPESHAISVDLKHQEMEEKKDPGLVNNVIEETVSKLIQARKSKVKALVGAFETIVSGNIGKD